MTRRQRLLNQIRGEEIDRVPMVGGWNLGVRNLADLAGITIEEYLHDPLRGVVRANQCLGVDAMVEPIVPKDIHAIREGSVQEQQFSHVEPEALVARAEAIPDTEEKVLAAVALYPDAVERIYWESSVLSRERNKIVIRLMREYGLPPMLLCGEDICVNRGPMVSPDFLRQRYWPHDRYALEPFLDAGIRLIHHCDGNVMPLVDDMIETGFSGFQGFQYECGVDPRELRQRRSRLGEEPLLLGGLSVTRTLPLGGPADVIEEVEYCLDCTDAGRGFFLFTSNVTGVEVPPENVRTAYWHLAAYDPRRPRGKRGRQVWPWRKKHPE